MIGLIHARPRTVLKLMDAPEGDVRHQEAVERRGDAGRGLRPGDAGRAQWPDPWRVGSDVMGTSRARRGKGRGHMTDTQLASRNVALELGARTRRETL
jgi:hypothetical protein